MLHYTGGLLLLGPFLLIHSIDSADSVNGKYQVSQMLLGEHCSLVDKATCNANIPK